MELAKTSQKGQVLIPKKLRKKVGLKPGSFVSIEEQNGLIILKPVPENIIELACGYLKGDYSLTDDLLKERKKEKQREDKDCS